MYRMSEGEQGESYPVFLREFGWNSQIGPHNLYHLFFVYILYSFLAVSLTIAVLALESGLTALVLLQVGQNFLFFLNLSGVVLCLFVRDLYFEFIVIELFLLSFYFDAKFYVLFLQAISFLFEVLIDCLLVLRGLIHKGSYTGTGRQPAYQLLTLFSQHLQLSFRVDLFINRFLLILIELRNANVPFHLNQIYLQELQLRMDWKNKPNQIFNKVKQQMYSKGVETFHFVDQFISQFDPNFAKVLSSHFFNLFLNKIGVFLTTQEIRNIRDLYGKNKDEDLILYIDFLQDVKYSLSEKVAAVINQAFEVLDKKHENSLSLEQLTKSYNPQNHPHALSRKKSPEDIQAEFVNAISRKADEKGRVSQKAFIDYYAELNFCVPNERESYFEQLIIGTWNLTKPEDYVNEKRLREIELTLYEKIRLKSDGKTNEWKTGKKALSYFDLGDTRYADFAAFKKGLDKFGCNFKENEMRVLFDKYAANGTLDYEQFVKEIMEIDINGMISKPNLLQTKMGTNHFTVTH